MKRTFGRAPLLLGHRGAPQAAPENTIRSFAAALDAGLDGLELDLQYTRDDVLAVVHDPLLQDVPIADLSWRELKERAPLVPRIEDVLELVEGHPGAYLNIEVKTPVPKRDGREATLAALLRAWDAPAKERCWISSFDPFSLLGLARHHAGVPLALLAASEDALGLFPCLPVTGVHVKHTLLSEEAVAGWRERDLFVFTWTVNDRDTADRALRLGVDGLIGDVPDLLLAAREDAAG